MGFLFGFAIGLALSLTYGWVIDPRPAPIRPADLRVEDKALYLHLIALALAHDKDEAKAQARLATLGDADIEGSIIALTEQYIEQGNDIRDITALIALSRTMGQTTNVMAAFIASPTPIPTSTPTLAPTPTPRPHPNTNASDSDIYTAPHANANATDTNSDGNLDLYT